MTVQSPVTGRTGYTGRGGETGRPGTDGQPGHYGCVTWKVLHPDDGHTILKSKNRYELAVEDYDVSNQLIHHG